MGAFAVPLLVASAATTAVAGVRQGQAFEAQGKAEQADLNRQAELERLGAKDRSIERRRRLNTVLAGQIARTGAAGITFEGTPAAVAKGDVQQFELEEAGAKFSDLERISQLRRAGSAARRRGKQAKRTTLLQTGATVLGQSAVIASRLPPKKKKKEPET